MTRREFILIEVLKAKVGWFITQLQICSGALF
jgi:hypothetical protein